MAILGRKLGHGGGSLEQIAPKRRADRGVEVRDRVAETRDGGGRGAALPSLHGRGDAVELAVEVRGLAAREQVGTAATGDEK
jgi:hypothetical protein